MQDHIINIHLSELLRIKTKESKINEHKKKRKKKEDNLHFLPNDIFTRLYKELIYIYIYIYIYKNDYQ